MDHSAWERRKRRLDRDGAQDRDEDLERTVALGGPGVMPPEALGTMGETMQLHAPGQGMHSVPRQGGPAGEAYGGGYGEADGDYGGERRRRGFSRRVLFAVGGLTLVGGCGVAAAMKMSDSGSPTAPSPSPSPSHSPTPAPTKSPEDLSSSAAGPPSPSPPDVANPGSGVDPHKVQTAPEYYVHAGPKVVALTLDDGPSPIYTPQVLDLLAQYRIQATFCMIGRQVAANHSLVSEVVAAGHTIANHTWDHADQSRLSLSGVRSEIARTNDALASVGVQPTIFRAPYGAWSHAVFEACAMADLRPLDWSVDPRDWSRPGVSTIVTRVMHQTGTGSIILEHDGGGDRSQTVAALKIFLPRLLELGYRFTGV